MNLMTCIVSFHQVVWITSANAPNSFQLPPLN